MMDKRRASTINAQHSNQTSITISSKKRVLLLKFTVYVEYPGKEQETTGPLHFLNPSTML